MAEHIYPKVINGKTYYYLQKTYREKIEGPGSGKTKGSGKSRVRTKSIYLGTAQSIMERLNRAKEPVEARHREFGLSAAALQTAQEIGLCDLLKEHIKGERYGTPRWLYFMLPVLNRISRATSKEQMGKWSAKTVLPDLLGFDPARLNSKTFWYATDDVISEKELKKRRREAPEINDDLFAGLDDSVFIEIEQSLFANLRERFHLSASALLYDTTNFFTYIEEPVRSKLARPGHNKDCRHHLKQVGLAMCVDKEWGLPLFHRLYRGNSQDAGTFAGLVDDLILSLRAGFDKVDDLVLVLDKGNNSKENFAALKGKVQWVGSLVLSHYPDLVDLSLDDYSGRFEQMTYYKCVREVMGLRCALVLTYNEKLAVKQEHTLQNGIERLKAKVLEKWQSYKKRPRQVPAGVLTMLRQSRYGKYLRVELKGGELCFSETEAVDEQRKRFGKNLLFAGDPGAEAGWIISNYKSKERIEDAFKLIKDPDLVRWRPSRHWTDTKIRAYGFCCVMALALVRVMQLKAELAGLRMSASVLKEELIDLQEVVMIYDDKTAQTKITGRSKVQEKLWRLFDLGAMERRLTIH